MLPETPIDPAKMYRVTLAESVRVGRVVVNPGSNSLLRGDVLKGLIVDNPGAVLDFEEEA